MSCTNKQAFINARRRNQNLLPHPAQNGAAPLFPRAIPQPAQNLGPLDNEDGGDDFGFDDPPNNDFFFAGDAGDGLWYPGV